MEVLERPRPASTVQEDLIPQEDEDEEMDDGADDEDEESERDETELELERLVFGDSVGFREGLKDSALAVREDEEDDEQADGLDGLDDADVGQALEAYCLLRLVC